MALSATRFSQLLYEGIAAIQLHESETKKKSKQKIYTQLTANINRPASTIGWYLKGNVPTALFEIEQLAKDIFLRGKLSEQWLEAFLKAAGHPQVGVVLQQIVSPSAQASNEEQTFQSFQCKRISHSLKRTFFSDRSSETHVKISMVATQPFGVPSIRHRTVLTSYRSQLPPELEFIPVARSGAGTISHKVFNQTSDLLLWHVLFNPPLRQGETASYEYTVRKKALYPWTLEELQEHYERGETLGLFTNTNLAVIVPTEYLYLAAELPPNYEITFPQNGGIHPTRLDIEDIAERTRIIKENSFQVHYDAIQKKWLLELSLKNPKLGCSYQLHWIPPSETESST